MQDSHRSKLNDIYLIGKAERISAIVIEIMSIVAVRSVVAVLFKIYFYVYGHQIVLNL
jgi:hypothetical protein